MLSAIISGFLTYRAVKRKSRTKTPPALDLGAIAQGRVPAHGYVSGQRFKFISESLSSWLKRLAGVVGIAAMIAIGLFIYTEFTNRWRERGLPVLPIQAFAMASEASVATGHYGSSPRPSRGAPAPSSPVSRGQMSLLDTYR